MRERVRIEPRGGELRGTKRKKSTHRSMVLNSVKRWEGKGVCGSP